MKKKRKNYTLPTPRVRVDSDSPQLQRADPAVKLKKKKREGLE
jgi:hypothetical protein